MGVKSLWSLLTPVGRPVMLETIEGKVMAIDSSIWIYQFQATMRDKEGRALSNAHVLGFLRRISKLLFYGIKPIFVFDGGAPVLKRATITERKKKKSGAAASHVKIAEQLLAAQMRREALNHAQSSKSSSKGKGKAPASSLIDENTVYLEDVDPSVSKAPARKDLAKAESTPSSLKKKSKFYDHDPYRLPEVDLEAAITKATRSAAPDPRLATEDELRAFIEEMRPEDLDVTSPAFQGLPTEIQYEIVSDLRIKSRQTSFKRLEAMLKNSRTPLDFSRQQIQHLKQRNSLTQQFWMTADGIGSALTSTIPVRIASERNREYVLMKNEGEAGGWILGIRDDGTEAKPIEIDHDEDEVAEEESDIEMEEVNIPQPQTPDSDLHEYQREMALSAAMGRYSPKKLAPLTTKFIQRRPKTQPLFDIDPDDPDLALSRYDESDNDEDLAFAIQVSLDHAKSAANILIPEESNSLVTSNAYASSSSRVQPTKNIPNTLASQSSTLSVSHVTDDDDLFQSSTRLETALSIANAGPLRHTHHNASNLSAISPFRRSSLSTPSRPALQALLSDESVSGGGSQTHLTASYSSVTAKLKVPVNSSAMNITHDADQLLESDDDDDESDMEEIIPAEPFPKFEIANDLSTAVENHGVFTSTHSPQNQDILLDKKQKESDAEIQSHFESVIASHPPRFNTPDVENDVPQSWSRSPSPVTASSEHRLSSRLVSPVAENWDAAQEMDLHAEQGEFARFMSQVKGKDIDDVRQEIDEEIRTLNQQKKVAMRDSEDITQQMISQIMTMLRLFGIPYITAPMEAEAQCAELVALGLAEGIITDDSDVFLFGGLRVFKNMFNQSKTVECFLLSDLSRELGLDRDTLVRLAYLLGSDYVEGIPGVGPVVAMEVLKEFPGQDGLHKFKDWWLRVQTGKDKEEDNKSAFRKRFKKKFKDLYIPQEWPNSEVRDAYYHPSVDSSDEPFKWGLPDLDGLRGFLREELGWQQVKVDDLLLPIIQKMGKRGQTAALNKQGNLNEFFDVTAGAGTYAPRKRQAYSSKRLQQVVSEFRNQRGSRDTPVSEGNGFDEGTDEEGPAKKKVKRVARSKSTKEANISVNKASGRKVGSKTRVRPAMSQGSSVGSKVPKVQAASLSSDEDTYDGGHAGGVEDPAPPLAIQLRSRPRPRPAYKGPPS